MYKTIKTHVVPYDTNFTKIRLGNLQDGGYVIAEIGKYDALYSYGCDNKLTFEEHFHQKYDGHCYLYDHTHTFNTPIPKHITFFKEGVSDVKTDTMDTMDSHILKNGHMESTHLLLQMDIEGSEWKSLLTCKHLTNFSQLIIEFHLCDDIIQNDPESIIQCFEKINNNFTCVHIHGNNSLYVPWFWKNIPYVFEVTYVRNDLITQKHKRMVPFPEPGVDCPNVNWVPELPLYYFMDDNPK
jgi:hypothetical protein